MTNEEKEILADAIELYIEAEKKARLWQFVAFGTLACIVMITCIILGG